MQGVLENLEIFRLRCKVVWAFQASPILTSEHYEIVQYFNCEKDSVWCFNLKAYVKQIGNIAENKNSKRDFLA